MLPLLRRSVGSWYFAIVLVVLRGITSLAAAEPAETSRPNVLVLFSDDQRADTIHALGNDLIETPNLDRLVRLGTTFTNAHCMGSNNGAVCVPSRAMLLSGRSLSHIRENLNGVPTWPEAFAAAGYRTFVTGKWHNEPESARRCFQSGSAVFLGGMKDPYKITYASFEQHGEFTPRKPIVRHSSEVFADAAIDFLSAKHDAPFLCYVAFNAPHDPRIAPPEYHERYNAKKPDLPKNFLPVHPFDNGEMTIRDEQLLPTPRDPQAVRQALADYYASIGFLDEQIGRILDTLEKHGLTDNTLVVFSSDHGLAIGSHGLLGKQNLYEHSMRAPLIFAGPKIPADKRCDALCYLFDIFPTLGELCDVPPPAGNEGVSLAAAFRGSSEVGRAELLTQYRDVQRAVRDSRWKLIEYHKIGRVQLFDLQSDPDEMHDLADDPQFRAERERLLERLNKLQAKS